MGKSACCINMRISVQIPSTHIKNVRHGHTRACNLRGGGGGSCWEQRNIWVLRFASLAPSLARDIASGE